VCERHGGAEAPTQRARCDAPTRRAPRSARSTTAATAAARREEGREEAQSDVAWKSALDFSSAARADVAPLPAAPPYRRARVAVAAMEAPVVTVETSMGTFAVECVRFCVSCAVLPCRAPRRRERCTCARRARLYTQHAPKTCKNFLEVRAARCERCHVRWFAACARADGLPPAQLSKRGYYNGIPYARPAAAAACGWQRLAAGSLPALRARSPQRAAPPC
jgi:hypothetical protein